MFLFSQGFSSDSARFVLFFICFFLQIVQLILCCFSEQQSRLNQVWISTTKLLQFCFTSVLSASVFSPLSLEPMSSCRSLNSLQVIFLLVQWVKTQHSALASFRLVRFFSNQIIHLKGFMSPLTWAFFFLRVWRFRVTGAPCSLLTFGLWGLKTQQMESWRT